MTATHRDQETEPEHPAFWEWVVLNLRIAAANYLRHGDLAAAKQHVWKALQRIQRARPVVGGVGHRDSHRWRWRWLAGRLLSVTPGAHTSVPPTANRDLTLASDRTLHTH